MVFLKSIKKIMMIIAITYISVGFLLIIKPSEILLIFEVLSCGLGIAGLFLMIRYFTFDIANRIKRDDFLIGGLIIAIAIIIYLYRKNFTQTESIKYIFCVMMCLSGFVKIQDAFDTSATGHRNIIAYLLLFIICVAFGAVVLIANFKSNTFAFILMGVGLIIAGASDLISTFYIASCLSSYEKKIEDDKTKVNQEELVKIIEEENVEEIKEEEPKVEENKEIEETQVEEVKVKKPRKKAKKADQE